MFLNEILERFENVKPQGKGFMVRCPAHDDRINSLSIKQRGNKILLKCHAGCDTESILGILGLSMSDLFEPDIYQNKTTTKTTTNPKPKPQNIPPSQAQQYKIIETYDYKDENDKLVHQTVRYEPKKFLQRQPNPNKPNDWVWNLQDINPILYNLKELIKAVENQTPVIIVEGEKDCENIRKYLSENFNLVTTTCPMGAGKWREYYSDWLINAEVYIIPDNDKSGQEHAHQVATSLFGKAKSIKIASLAGIVPDKGDVSDFILSRIHSEKILNEDFWELLEKAKIFENTDINIDSSFPQTSINEHMNKPKEAIKGKTSLNFRTHMTWTELSQEEIPPLPFIIDKLLPEGLFILAGAPKVGKSWLLLDLCISVAEGKPWLDHNSTQGHVVYYALEDNWRRLQSRVRYQYGELKHGNNLFFAIKPVGITELGKEIDKVLKDRPDTKLICVDTLAYIRDIDGSQPISYSNDRRDMSLLKEIANFHGITILGTQHTRKMPDINNVINQISGSTGLTGTTDGNMVLHKKTNMENKATLTIENRDTESFIFDLEFNKERCKWNNLGVKTYDDPVQGTGKEGFAEIFLKHYLADGEPKSYKEIKERADLLGITDKQLRNAREGLNVKFTSKGSQGTIWYL